MNILYLKIKELADKKGVSLAQIERDLNFSNGIISSWKNGRASQDKLAAIADYFDVSTDYLLGRPEKSNNDENTDKELDEMLDEARSFDGHPITDNDRALLKDFLKSYYKNKES